MFVFSNVIAAITAIVLCNRSKKEIDVWDGEDECIDRTEQRLNYSLVLANLMTVVNFLLFSASLWAAEHTGLNDHYEFVMLMVSLAVFVLGMVWVMCVSNRVVKLVQKINPEKRGNILEPSSTSSGWPAATKRKPRWFISADFVLTVRALRSAWRCGY